MALAFRVSRKRTSSLCAHDSAPMRLPRLLAYDRQTVRDMRHICVFLVIGRSLVKVQ